MVLYYVQDHKGKIVAGLAQRENETVIVPAHQRVEMLPTISEGEMLSALRTKECDVVLHGSLTPELQINIEERFCCTDNLQMAKEYATRSFKIMQGYVHVLGIPKALKVHKFNITTVAEFLEYIGFMIQLVGVNSLSGVSERVLNYCLAYTPELKEYSAVKVYKHEGVYLQHFIDMLTGKISVNLFLKFIRRSEPNELVFINEDAVSKIENKGVLPVDYVYNHGRYLDRAVSVSAEIARETEEARGLTLKEIINMIDDGRLNTDTAI